MPYCSNCGSKVTSKFCIVCGKPLSKKQRQKLKDNLQGQSIPPVAPAPTTQPPPQHEDSDSDQRPQQDDFERDSESQRDDFDRDRESQPDDYERDSESQRDDYERDSESQRDDFDRDRESQRDDFDRDSESQRDDFDRNKRPERDDYNRDSREPPDRSPTEEHSQQPPPPPRQTPKPRPRVGGAIFGVIFLFLLLMLLGIMPRPYIIFDEDDPNFGKDFTLLGNGGTGGNSGNEIPSDLIGVWRTSGATLTFTSSGTGNLQMDDGFYISFTYRVVDNNKIYFTYSGGTEEKDYSKILTLTSTTLTLQATDVSAGNYMGATTTYTK